jgi:hypothetical protein
MTLDVQVLDLISIIYSAGSDLWLIHALG